MSFWDRLKLTFFRIGSYLGGTKGQFFGAAAYVIENAPPGEVPSIGEMANAALGTGTKLWAEKISSLWSWTRVVFWIIVGLVILWIFFGRKT